MTFQRYREHCDIEIMEGIMSSFATRSNRDGWATIRGFVYQVDLTLVRWLDLQIGQALELECGEDIDLVSQMVTAKGETQQRLLEQVKHREASSLTLRSPEAVAALVKFFEHQVANSEITLFFRYTNSSFVYS